MLRPIIKKTKEVGKSTYGSALLTYDLITNDGTVILSSQRCKDWINNQYTAKKDLAEEQIKKIYFKNYKMRFRLNNSIPIDNFKNSIRFANAIFSAIGGIGKLKLRFVEEVKDKNYRLYIVQFPEKVIFMPPVLSLLVQCLRTGFYYTDCDYLGYIDRYEEIDKQDTLKCLEKGTLENSYLKTIKSSIQKFNDMGGIYEIFNTNPKQMWKERHGNLHGGNGIVSFVTNQKKRYTED